MRGFESLILGFLPVYTVDYALAEKTDCTSSIQGLHSVWVRAISETPGIQFGSELDYARHDI
jgi:hypothetical protein